MLYHWLYPLADTFGALNVVRYITFRTAAATLTALFISFIVGPWLIKRLAALRVGQPIRAIGPDHAAKEGTPAAQRYCPMVLSIAGGSTRNRFGTSASPSYCSIPA